jgi:ApbE superfamily uncharacterized protein (UPF0280 family)
LGKEPSDPSHRFYRYRHHIKGDWCTFQARYRETDLWIRARRNLEKEALEAVLKYRRQIEDTISRNPEFLRSLTPLPEDPLAPVIVKRMIRAAGEADVGPMAAVAGAVAEAVAEDLQRWSPDLVVENGGDCYLSLRESVTVGVYAGPDSPFRDRIALRFEGHRFPLAICTSSGTIGHSLSLGKADAVTVVARDGALADAAATAIGNLVRTRRDVDQALEAARSIGGIDGALIVMRDRLGIWGDMELALPGADR